MTAPARRESLTDASAAANLLHMVHRHMLPPDLAIPATAMALRAPVTEALVNAVYGYGDALAACDRHAGTRAPNPAADQAKTALENLAAVAEQHAGIARGDEVLYARIPETEEMYRRSQVPSLVWKAERRADGSPGLVHMVDAEGAPWLTVPADLVRVNVGIHVPDPRRGRGEAGAS